MKPIVDYLLVIPLDEEFRYLREVVQRFLPRSLKSITIGNEVYTRALLEVEDCTVSLVILTVGRMGTAAAQSAVEAAANLWRPAAIVMVGIAGSLVPDTLRLGDVIVPTQIVGYSQAKVEARGKRTRFNFRRTGYQVDCALAALARAFARNAEPGWRGTARRAGRAQPKLREMLAKPTYADHPKLHLAFEDQLASGELVVASRAFARTLRDQLGTKICAVEMEAQGLCEAIRKLEPQPAILIVRGISDLADEDKAQLEASCRDGWRRFAAQNATRFALGLIRARPSVQEGHRAVALPRYALELLPDAVARCLDPRHGIRARDRGQVMTAFAPIMQCGDGLAGTTLRFAALRPDGSFARFTDYQLRCQRDRSVLKEGRNRPSFSHELARTGSPDALELLAGLPEAGLRIELTATDEFKRTARVVWPN